MELLILKGTKAMDEPYWRGQVQVARGGRLEWYGEPATEDFWARVWEQRLKSGYFDGADRGDLLDLESVLTRRLLPQGLHLEAGCGLGYWVAAVQARGYRIEGIEYSERLVALLNSVRGDLQIRRADALAIDRPDGHYDSYLSFGVVEHRLEGPEPFLAEAYRVLKPGGTLILSVPFFCRLRRLKARLGLYEKRPPETEFFQFAFGEPEFRGFLERANFQIEETHYQSTQRCMVEELPLYFRLNRMRGSRYLRRMIGGLVPPRQAAHMVLFVARKPGAPGPSPDPGKVSPP